VPSKGIAQVIESRLPEHQDDSKQHSLHDSDRRDGEDNVGIGREFDLSSPPLGVPVTRPRLNSQLFPASDCFPRSFRREGEAEARTDADADVSMFTYA